MKKIYEAPTLEIELYWLDANIAGNCDPVVDFGPGYPNSNGSIVGMCTYFIEQQAFPMSVDTSFYNPGQYQTVCTCYYNAGGEGYFTS